MYFGTLIVFVVLVISLLVLMIYKCKYDTFTNFIESPFGKVDIFTFWLNQDMYKKVVTIVENDVSKFIMYQSPRKITTKKSNPFYISLYSLLNSGSKYKVYASNSVEQYLFKLVVYCTQPHHPEFTYEFTNKDSEADIFARTLPLKTNYDGNQIPVNIHYFNELDLKKATFFVPFLKWQKFMNTLAITLDNLIYFKGDITLDMVNSAYKDYEQFARKFYSSNTYYRKSLPYLDEAK